MSPPIFISYRRADSAAEAGRLHTTLLHEFGTDSVFMDAPSIDLGSEWPDQLENALKGSKIVIAVMGQNWLRISDEYGMRRIDDPTDWVRREIEYALTHPTEVLPVLVGGAKLPPADKLPQSVSPLVRKQAVDIRETYWEHDIQLVLQRIRSILGDKSGTPQQVEIALHSTPYPIPPAYKPAPMSDEAVEAVLINEIPQWKKRVSPLPQDPSKIRIELHRHFRFKTFVDVIGFMNQVAPGCEIAMHHPRWENIWRSLNVYLTTWDIGHCISDRDIVLAKYLDRAYSEYPGADPSFKG